MSFPNIPIKEIKEDFCPFCQREIDPDVCWCGDYLENHTFEHSPVPMGCVCGYYTEEDNKYISKILAEKYPETHNKV